MICIIIPCYNEERRFPRKEFLDYLKRSPDDQYFLLVDDGSSDETWGMIHDLMSRNSKRVRGYQLKKNRGKAEAVRQGIVKAMEWQEFEALGYFDADLATPLTEISHLLEVLSHHPQVVLAFGSRVKLFGRQIQRDALRHYFGRVFATAASIILKLPIYDTQCGAKLFKTPIALQVVQQPFMSRWLFDIEIFARLKHHLGIKNLDQKLIEVPLKTWIEKGATKIKPMDLVKVPAELIRIYWKYRKF